ADDQPPQSVWRRSCCRANRPISHQLAKAVAGNRRHRTPVEWMNSRKNTGGGSMGKKLNILVRKMPSESTEGVHKQGVSTQRCPPTFLGIGSMRCGSTWLYEVLRCHPDIQLTNPKEIGVFFSTPRTMLQHDLDL